MPHKKVTLAKKKKTVVKKSLKKSIKKKSEKAESHLALQQQLQLALDAAHMGVWEWDIKKDKVNWSNNVYALFGIKNTKPLTLERYREMLHPEDVESVTHNIQHALSSGSKYFIQHRIIQPSGELRWIEAVGKVFRNKKGEPIKMIGTASDVTEKKLVELEVEDWKTRYELVVSSSGQLIYDYTIETGDILWAGDTLGVLGFSKEEMGNIDQWVKMIHPKDRDQAFADLEKAQAEVKPYEVRYRFKTKKGTYREILDRGMFLARKGEAYRMLGVMIDMTQQIAIQNTLKEKNLFIESITSAIPDIIHVLDIKTLRPVFANKSLLTELGYSTAETIEIQKDYTRILPPDAANVYQEAKKNFEELVTQEFVHSEFQIKSKNNKWNWFTSQYAVFKRDKKGNPTQVIGSLRNITEYKISSEALLESEVRFKTLQHASYGGIALHDMAVIIDCNQGLSELMGYPYEELVGMNGLLLLAPEHRDIAMNNIKNNYDSPYDVDGLRKDGSRISIEVRGKEVPYKGKMIRVTEFRDITERKRSSEHIIQQNQKLVNITEDLQRKNEQLEEFTQIVSHNLRSPVGNILSLLTYYEATSVPAEKVEYFSLLKESAQNTMLTLNELNDVLKVKHNQDIERHYVEFEKILHYVRGMVSVAIAEAGATISFDFSEAPIIHYPNIYLESILLNLISNSLKYRHTLRAPHIQLKSFKQNGATFLTVSDNGLGIDLEKYGHLLFRMRKTFHHHPESRGVGLFLIKSQINAMGGEISAQSKLNEGITFTIKF